MNIVICKRFEKPDETLSAPKFNAQIVVLGEIFVAKVINQPGWRWSNDIKPLVGTPACQHHHQGVMLSGSIQIILSDGTERAIEPGEVYDVPPGHDAFVLGDQPAVAIEFRHGAAWARPRISGDRVLTTLLLTDIVNSTPIATQLGDLAWKKLLSQHFDRVRLSWTVSEDRRLRQPAMDS